MSNSKWQLYLDKFLTSYFTLLRYILVDLLITSLIFLVNNFKYISQNFLEEPFLVIAQVYESKQILHSIKGIVFFVLCYQKLSTFRFLLQIEIKKNEVCDMFFSNSGLTPYLIFVTNFFCQVPILQPLSTTTILIFYFLPINKLTNPGSLRLYPIILFFRLSIRLAPSPIPLHFMLCQSS